MIEVRRADDDELCGFVAEGDGEWSALAIFGGRLGGHERRDEAERQVREAGLSSLAERWTLVDLSSGEEQIVCIQEASPSGVTVALGYYSLPGVPSLSLTSEELAGDRWRLER